MSTKQAMHRLFEKTRGDFRVVYQDGSIERYGAGRPQFTIHFRDGNVLADDDLLMSFGEAYVNGQVDVEGDLADLVALAITGGLISAAPTTQRFAGRVVRTIRRRSLKRQRSDVAAHYDLGNEFFRLWLDESLTYSCAYFRHSSDTLEQAQKQKIEHSLKKLRLKPGQSLLDIGCGWGSLAMQAAEQHGVKALGITLSEQQHAFANKTAELRGLTDKAQVRLLDYGTLAKKGRQFDKIISIGMIEHVGKAHLVEFCQAVETLLKPGGLALLHLITGVTEGSVNRWVEKHIFPGGYIPSFSEIINHLTARDFRILDVENLAPHYRLTLDRWSKRFERQTGPVRQMFNERFVRMWRLYLRASSASFRQGLVEVHQILISRGQTPDLPLTREQLYAGLKENS